MDLSTPQTVAQAVQAATQAAAQVSQSPPPQLQQSQAPIAQSSAVDNLTCQWQGCGERCDSAESLYDHVCERHVGRKSTNNLNLTCAWGPCRTTTVKRDHITSHIRVHVPLKPHKCDICSKAFKRPQDLKKHVKTHADDSVLMSSPQQPNPGHGAMGGVAQMGQQHGKAFAPANAYYGGHDNSLVNPYPTYQPMVNGSNGAGYPHPNNGQYAGYGSVSYPNSSGAMQDLQSMDTRRRIIEALNDFLGDIKRRAIDPAAYYDVGQRLQANTLPLPTGSGYNTGYNNSSGYNGYGNTANLLESFTNAPPSNGGNHNASGGVQGPMASHAYSLPISNARTKDDLHDIDRFLEQLQATVYETSNSNHVAAAGVAHTGMHSTFAGDFGNFGGHMGNTHNRDSHSPSSLGDSSMTGASAVGASNLTVSQPSGGTPALTPASVSSYDSTSHSPLSSHGRSSLGSMYPNLSNVPSTSNMGPEYPMTTSAPASSLAYGMDGMDTRRYSGSRLQRQRDALPADTDMLDISSLEEGASTPKAAAQQSERPRKDSNNGNTIDPALRDADVNTPSDRSRSTPAVRSDGSGVDEQWVENIRIIEALRRWILERLKTGDYEDSSANSVAAAVAAAAAAQQADDADDEDARQAAAIAKLAEETMADVDHDEVKYPTLPTA